MPSTTVSARDNTGHEQGALHQLAIEYNKLVAKMDALLAKLDADAGVTDTNYGSTLNSASTAGARQVTDDNGTVIA